MASVVTFANVKPLCCVWWTKTVRLSDGSGRNPFRKDPPEGWNHFFLPLGRLKKPLGVSGREKTSRERFFLCLLPVSSRASVFFLLVLLVLSRSGVLCKWWPIFFLCSTCGCVRERWCSCVDLDVVVGRCRARVCWCKRWKSFEEAQQCCRVCQPELEEYCYQWETIRRQGVYSALIDSHCGAIACTGKIYFLFLFYL